MHMTSTAFVPVPLVLRFPSFGRPAAGYIRKPNEDPREYQAGPAARGAACAKDMRTRVHHLTAMLLFSSVLYSFLYSWRPGYMSLAFRRPAASKTKKS